MTIPVFENFTNCVSKAKANANIYIHQKNSKQLVQHSYTLHEDKKPAERCKKKNISKIAIN